MKRWGCVVESKQRGGRAAEEPITVGQFTVGQTDGCECERMERDGSHGQLVLPLPVPVPNCWRVACGGW